MGGGFVGMSMDRIRKKKRWILLLGLIGFSSYGAYKVYHMPSVARKRKRISKLLASLVSVAEMVTDSADTVAIVSREIKEFLSSDADELPTSLKQLSKIARSEEFSKSVTTVTQAMTVGILRGYRGGNENCEIITQSNGSNFPDRLVDKLMSSAGTGFVSIVVGSFARNLVLGFYGDGGMGNRLSENSWFGLDNEKSSSSVFPSWITVLLDDRSKLFVADCIKTFVSTAVAVYLDKTMHINFIDDVLATVTDPRYQNKVTDLLVSLCNGAVETLVKTSHEVLTASKQSPDFESNHSFSIVEDIDNESANRKGKLGVEAEPFQRTRMNGYTDPENNGWITSVSSTLAVPSNRKFVLDVTGRVAFETARSMTQLFWSKISETMKTNLNVKRGFEVVSYVGAKSSVLLTVCLALLLHILADSRALVSL